MAVLRWWRWAWVLSLCWSRWSCAPSWSADETLGCYARNGVTKAEQAGRAFRQQEYQEVWWRTTLTACPPVAASTAGVVECREMAVSGNKGGARLPLSPVWRRRNLVTRPWWKPGKIKTFLWRQTPCPDLDNSTFRLWGGGASWENSSHSVAPRLFCRILRSRARVVSRATRAAILPSRWRSLSQPYLGTLHSARVCSRMLPSRDSDRTV